jgi:glycosyltransferase involved in cell wall biosynthesis
MTIAFFHQNAVEGVQGGIERYLATLLAAGGNRCLLVTEVDAGKDQRRFGVSLPVGRRWPQWLRFTLGVWREIKQIRTFLRQNKASVIELSRPEYILFSFLLSGKKVFTLHGTGPARTETSKYILHRLACYALPLLADRVHIVGRDSSGLPPSVRFLMRRKIHFIDAWYDDVFRPTPLPDLAGPLKIFYAGRLAKMKNPELLYAIVRKMKKDLGDQIEFSYFGHDGADIPNDLRNSSLADKGLLPAPRLAQAIAACHLGVLCSSYGEGSPFIVIETLACGRGYVVPALPGLLETYCKQPGVRFAASATVEAFSQKILALFDDMKKSRLRPEDITHPVAARSKGQATSTLLDALESLERTP